MDINRGHIDIDEETLYKMGALDILVLDRTTNKNIIWATDEYSRLGTGYQFDDPISISCLLNYNADVLKPRVLKPRAAKTKEEQLARARFKAEVFTPVWICNKQNNLVDDYWFGSTGNFNIETGNGWLVNDSTIEFPTKTGKTWKDYVLDRRLEITCGEAPYLVSRYDCLTGDMIDLNRRVGILDRKMRVIKENTRTEEEWIKWTLIAFKCVYGYDLQGDNVLLARENLLVTFMDYYYDMFKKVPPREAVLNISEIISWNIWQMDGLKFVIPNSCKLGLKKQISFFDDLNDSVCDGCVNGNPFEHTGLYCLIKDWETGKTIRFVSLIKGGI